MNFKSPKIEKIYEALSVLADSRIEYTTNTSAKIYSSDKSKFYTLIWNDEYDKFYSDDNASKWQSTLGYPIIAVLFDKHKLPCNISSLPPFAGINWNAINKEFKRDYAAATDFFLDDKFDHEKDRESIKNEVKEAYKILTQLKIRKSSKKELVVK